MLGILLLVIGIYALAALSVHLAYRIQQGYKPSGKHYVFVAEGEHKRMEWYMRSMLSFSRWMGKEVKVTIVDRGIDGETLAIIDRMSKDSHKLQVRVHPDQAVVFDEKRSPKERKRSHMNETDATQLMWLLQEEGVVSKADHAVLVDLQNPADLSKMPF
ncbi:hypothetical protein [Paenibacillus sp. sgz302251]|uniref:hypothetical protein n=1 Tax=Paenibacillus sp. sgz302251 TaxID=3414493 RepID=UPI003C7EB01C